ncbi:unnamed protein product, partial [Lymnaea stagnalis]
DTTPTTPTSDTTPTTPTPDTTPMTPTSDTTPTTATPDTTPNTPTPDTRPTTPTPDNTPTTPTPDTTPTTLRTETTPTELHGNGTCSGLADIVFVVDGSGSIGHGNFKIVLNFIRNITNLISTGGLMNFRIGMVTFSENATKIFDPYTYNDTESLDEVIANVHYPAQSTRTDLGLNLARSIFLDNGLSHVILLLTDGQSSNRVETKLAADILRANNITTLSVGITESINRKELEYISGSENIFTVDDFNQLQSVLEGLVQKTCESILEKNNSATNTTPTTPTPDTTPATTIQDTTKKTPTSEITPTTPTPDTTPSLFTTPTASNGNETCHGLADIIFVVDGSGSIGLGNFKIVLTFIRSVTNQFSTGGLLNFGIGMVTFSENATKIFDTYTYNYTESMDEVIANVHYPAQSTRTDLGLNLARSMFLDNGRSHVILLLTDGQSSNRLATKLAADVLRADNITTLSVGITESINRKELEYISGSENIFTVDDFNQLQSVLGALVQRTCESIHEKDNSVTITTHREDTTLMTSRAETTPRTPTLDTTSRTPTPDTEPCLFTTPTETPNLFCPGKADIVFVVDASGSIGKSNYEIVLSFVTNITAVLASGVPSDVRFGMVVYSGNVTQVFNLNTYNDIQEIQKAIATAPYFASVTRTDAGLDLAREMLTSEGRVHASHIVILLTDGISTARDQTKLAAQRLRDNNITAISIGVTDAVNPFELNEISLPGNVLLVGEFYLLRNVLIHLARQTCK